MFSKLYWYNKENSDKYDVHIDEYTVLIYFNLFLKFINEKEPKECFFVKFYYFL